MMNTIRYVKIAAALCLALPAFAQYKATQTGDIVRLEDAKTQTVLSIHPSQNNQAYEMTVKGNPIISGIPFLSPWANRLDQMAFYANGKKYMLNQDLGNIRAQAMHGFLAGNDKWKVIEVKSDANSAWVTSRLEFYRYPDWMAQFPFAHTIEETYRLQNGAVQLTTKIENLSAEPMPVSIGYHPGFMLPENPKRDEWTISVPARVHYILDKDKIPTGETEPIEKVFPNPQATILKGYTLDDVFGDLVRDSAGNAIASVKGQKQRIDVVLGPKYKSLVVFTPGPGRGATPAPQTVAFEPMVAPTDALNLAQKGLYKELQSIPPGGTWQESFWIRPSGF